MAGQVAEQLRGFNSQLQQTRLMVSPLKYGSKSHRVRRHLNNSELTFYTQEGEAQRTSRGVSAASQQVSGGIWNVSLGLSLKVLCKYHWQMGLIPSTKKRVPLRFLGEPKKLLGGIVPF